MSIQQHRFLLLSALCVGGLITANFVVTQCAQAEKSRPFGRYTAEQVTDRTERLCRAIASSPLGESRGGVGGLSLSAERILSNGEDATSRHHWRVLCTDGMGNRVAEFVWDADNGDLFYVGCQPPKSAARMAGRPLGREEAVRAAQKWLRTLGIAEKASRWHLARDPERSPDTWFVSWRAEGRTAAVRVDARTGDLMEAQSGQPLRFGPGE